MVLLENHVTVCKQMNKFEPTNTDLLRRETRRSARSDKH